MIRGRSLVFSILFAFASTPTRSYGAPQTEDVPLQPLAQQIRQIASALNLLGQPLGPETSSALNRALARDSEPAAIAGLEAALDPLVLVTVDINAESRVKVEVGAAKPELTQGGSRFFLVKVLNHAGVTSLLKVESPNSGRVFIPSANEPSPKMVLTTADVRDRWADLSLYDGPPLSKRLSGLPVEYRILEISSRDAGQRSAEISFHVGQGTQDIGFRNSVTILFHSGPAHSIQLQIRDEKGQPTTASLTIRDRLNRIYPSPSKRLAPDLFFQPQVYRADGEFIDLPPGYYTVTATGGPEYRARTQEFAVDAQSPPSLSIHLDRWIDPSHFGWYSGDHHVHAAGCSHYQNPAEGVLPRDMMRQIAGEKLNVGAVLTWGPDYYYQKQFFRAADDPLSQPNELMHYDLEVSGFPSSHAGHLVLLGLRDQEYPGTHKIEDWPTWDLPILRWAKSQGAVAGFAHSGWGLEVSGNEIPSLEMPGFDGIGANEYIVDVTYPGAVDFISAADTPLTSELSIWYHTLNVGFRSRIAGETDFPCITDERVGQGRSYVKVDGELSYAKWLAGLREGRSYVSDGRAHLMDFQVNGLEAGTQESTLHLASAGKVHVKVRVAARLDAAPHPDLQALSLNQKPYWNIERARIGITDQVPVELVVNGSVLARQAVTADGSVQDVAFDAPISQSSWIAVRILSAAHTNPIFVMVGGKPIRASRSSAEWCLNAVRQCWTQKAPRISVAERPDARAAYDHAIEVYRRLVGESGATQ